MFSLIQGNSEFGVRKATITIPRWGRWWIEGFVDGDISPTGSQTTSFVGDGLALTGSIIQERTGIFVNLVRFYMIAGTNGIQSVIDGQDYNSPQVRTIINDILNATGETLSTNSSNDILNTQLPRWTRVNDIASNQISTLVKYLNSNGFPDIVWRFDTDGTVLIKSEQWTDTTQQIGSSSLIQMEVFQDIRRDWWIEDLTLTNIYPGNFWDGKYISQLQIEVGEETTRLTTWFETGQSFTQNSNRLMNSLNNLVGLITQNSKFNVLFSGGISNPSTDSNGGTTVDFFPDSPFLPTVVGVPVKSIAPGVIYTPVSGSRAFLSYENNSPSSPIVIGFDGNPSTQNDTLVMSVNNKGAEVTLDGTNNLTVLGNPPDAQFMLRGSDVKNWLDNQMKQQFNQLLQDYGIHSHTGQAGPFPVVLVPGPQIPSTATAVPTSPDLSTKNKNS